MNVVGWEGVDEYQWDCGDGRLVLPFGVVVVEIDLWGVEDDLGVIRWRVYYSFESRTIQTAGARDLSTRGCVLLESFHFRTKSKIDAIPSVVWK